MSSNADDGGKKNNVVIISTVVAGLICLGIIVWVVWRFKGKLKGEILVSLIFLFPLRGLTKVYKMMFLVLTSVYFSFYF